MHGVTLFFFVLIDAALFLQLACLRDVKFH